MNVTHFAGSICRFARREGALTTTDARRVTCKGCRRSTMVLAAAVEQKHEREAEYAAAEPTTVRNPWDGSPVVCRTCAGTTFRSWGRSLDRHNHKCASCGEMSWTLTETGMSA